MKYGFVESKAADNSYFMFISNIRLIFDLSCGKLILIKNPKLGEEPLRAVF